MSLYSDLSEVLTPYANKIKELNGSLNDYKNEIYGTKEPLRLAQKLTKVRLKGDGTRIVSQLYSIKIFALDGAEYVKLTVPDCEHGPTYQWQSGIDTSVNNLVGTPVDGNIDGFIQVPEGATHLAVEGLLDTIDTDVVAIGAISRPVKNESDIAELSTAKETADRFNYVFNMDYQTLEPNVVYPFKVGEYARCPFGFATTQYAITFYNAEMQEIKHIGNAQQRNIFIFDSTTSGRYEIYTNEYELAARRNHGGAAMTFNDEIAYIKFSGYASYNRIFMEEPTSYPVYSLELNEERVDGFMQQITSSAVGSVIENIPTGDVELSRRLKCEMIHQINSMRHAFRICTLNVGRNAKRHWYRIKEAMQENGVDICGLQEVSRPNTTDDGPLFQEYFMSWHFKHASQNGDVYPTNERMLLTTEPYPIDSTEEFYFGLYTDHRYVAKSVVSLPRYRDKRGSEYLKMSVYNFQFEVANNRATENARALVNILANDDNPFIILMGDTNDFTRNKEAWGILEAAGFTNVVDIGTSTCSGPYDYSTIDTFFLSRRIKALDYDVINSYNYMFVNTGGGLAPLSDHNIVFADIELDYSDIKCIYIRTDHEGVIMGLPSKMWMTKNDVVQIPVTFEEGYEFKECWIHDDQFLINEEAYDYDNNIITLDGSTLSKNGDIYISVYAQEITS